jgi:hypothetical protein
MKSIVVAMLLIHGLTGSAQAQKTPGNALRPVLAGVSRGIVTVETIPTVVVEAKRIKNEKGMDTLAAKQSGKNFLRNARATEEKNNNGEYAVH